MVNVLLQAHMDAIDAKKKLSDWHAAKKISGVKQTASEFVTLGQEALNVLGVDPDHDTSKFKSFQQKHDGQWVCLFSFLFLSNFHVEYV